jgi:NAD(P)-dependent dehydrogenase (short-subunit alcohol dehydrogenase family)
MQLYLSDQLIDNFRGYLIMDLGLNGLKVIVTGGTKGIGRAIAGTFAREGADVAICARNGDDVNNTVAELKKSGGQALGRALDVGDGDAIKTWVSVSGRKIDFASGSYGAFKAALIHYTQGLAFHRAGKGIRANTVSPGNTFFEGGAWDRIQHNNPDLYNQALALNPTGRMATPQEIANAVVFVASPAASFVTGTNLVVDGALTRGVQL